MIRKFATTGLFVLAIAVPTLAARAQTAAEWISRGNAAYDARNAPDAVAAYDKALAILKEKSAALKRVAEALLEKEELQGKEVLALVGLPV